MATPETPSPRTFQTCWQQAASSYTSRPFLVFQSRAGTRTWTYGEFEVVVARTAGTLRAMGVRSGDAVHLALRNSPAFVAAWLAVTRLGAWMVPVDPASTARDVASQVQRTRPVVGLCAAQRSAAYQAGAQGDIPTTIALREDATDVAPGGPLDVGTPVSDSAEVSPSARLAVMFTSGTTSEPKGVVLTQENYAHVAFAMSDAVDLQRHHRWLVTLPLFHANAQYYCFAPAIARGASVALTGTFSASRWLQQAASLRATHASLFAAPIRMILARSEGDPPPLGLEHVWFAQSLGQRHYERFATLAGCRPRQLYGMTETIAAVTADTSRPLRHDVIGHPVGNRRVDIVDPQTGLSVAPGEPGVLMVHGARGRDLFAEYLEDAATTARAFEERPDGTWLRTGDVVRFDAGTRAYRFVGRVDDVIKVAGENVSLSEVEAALAQAPGVLEAAVIGQEDAVRDCVPVAYVVPQDPAAPPSVERLEAWARANLAPSARPRAWTLIDELPRTSVGKVRRFRVPT